MIKVRTDGSEAGPLRTYIGEHPEFKVIGERMLQEWKKGRELSLQSAWFPSPQNHEGGVREVSAGATSTETFRR
jgi:hypothetical protein